MLLDEQVEVHRVQVPPARVRKSGNVARRDDLRDPISEASALVGGSRVAATPGDLSQPAKALARQRVQHGIADAEEPTPRDRVVAREALADLRERDGREIEHRLRGEEIEVSHRFVGAGDDPIDLIGLRTEQRVVPCQCGCFRDPGPLFSKLKSQRETLDGAQAPRDSRREQGIDERVSMGHQRPPVFRRPRQAMLNTRPKRHRHQWPRVGEGGRQRRVAPKQRAPE